VKASSSSPFGRFYYREFFVECLTRARSGDIESESWAEPGASKQHTSWEKSTKELVFFLYE
jgi:hypothetical protein